MYFRRKYKKNMVCEYCKLIKGHNNLSVEVYTQIIMKLVTKINTQHKSGKIFKQCVDSKNHIV